MMILTGFADSPANNSDNSAVMRRNWCFSIAFFIWFELLEGGALEYKQKANNRLAGVDRLARSWYRASES